MPRDSFTSVAEDNNKIGRLEVSASGGKRGRFKWKRRKSRFQESRQAQQWRLALSWKEMGARRASETT